MQVFQASHNDREKMQLYILVRQIQTFLHFSPPEAWNYGKELWVNEEWHNPYFSR